MEKSEYENQIKELINEAEMSLPVDDFNDLLRSINFETWHRQQDNKTTTQNEDL